MRTLRAWMIRLASPLGAARREREMAEEFESNLQLHIDDNLRAGMTPREARRHALAKFGGVEAAKDAYRDRAGLPFLTHVVRDLRFAARLLARFPGFSATVIVTIALAVGVNATIFTVLNAAALRPLPVPGGNRLMTVSMSADGPARRGVHGMPSMLSYPEFQAVRDQTPAFQGAAAFSPFNGATLGGTEPRALNATLASCEYFDVLRVRATLGRTFSPRDCERGSTPTVVLNNALWRSAFAADPSIVGRTIQINRSPFVVIGVSEPGFPGTQLLLEDVFVPIVFETAINRDLKLLDRANFSWVFVVGRLRDEASAASARSDLKVIASRLTAALPPGNTLRLDAAATTLAGLPEIRSIVLTVGGVIGAAVVLVLLIACANIANLLLARGAARRREIAVRLALGASRRRLVQQLLTESLLLAAIGGAAGWMAGIWTSAAITRFLLSHMPPGVAQIVFDPRPDWRVATFALALTGLAGFAFGLVPALQATRGRLDIRESAATERPGGRRLQNALVAVQVALCLVLLLSAGLLARGLYRAHTIDPGLGMDSVLVVSYDLRGAGYTGESAAAFQRRAFDRISAMSGVRGVALASVVPLSDQHQETRFRLDSSENGRYLEFSQVSPSYFDLLGLRIVRGRNFLPEEVDEQRAAIVTESTARRLWPGADPLTHSLTLDDVPRPVVGVVADAQVSRLGQTDAVFVFLPAGIPVRPTSSSSPGRSVRSFHLLVAGGAGMPAPRTIASAVREFDAGLAVEVTSLADNLQQWRAPSLVFSSLAAALALLALVLACTGVFGTVAYTVSRRTREIGIRVALGAAHRDVQRLIVRQGMTPVAFGIAAGLAGAAAASAVLKNMLFGLSPHDPWSFVLVPATLAAIALTACIVPARRALRVEPTTALRVE